MMNKIAVAVTCLGVGIGICLLGYQIFSLEREEAENDYVKNLTLVQIVFRHGARNPTRFYNSDPYKDYDWLEGKGQLTNVGMTQLYEIGQKMRRKYAGFIPSLYSAADIRVVSSDVDRALSSAYVFLAGLYPPQGRQLWHRGLSWQPIPVHSIPRAMDNMLALKRPCSVVDSRYASVMSSPETNAPHREVLTNLSHHANDTVATVLDVEMMYSTWLIEQERSLTLPPWVHQYFPQPSRNLTCLSFRLFSHDTTMRRLRGGVLLKELIENMSAPPPGGRKMLVYSGHDLTLTALLYALGYEECILPEYGATLIMELRTMHNTTDKEVRLVYYNSSTVSEGHPMDIPGCGSPCTLYSLTQTTKHLLPTDWEQECNV